MQQATHKQTDPMWALGGRRDTRDYDYTAARPARAGAAAAPVVARRRPRRPCREMCVDPDTIAQLEAHYARPPAERRSPTVVRRLWRRLLG